MALFYGPGDGLKEVPSGCSEVWSHKVWPWGSVECSCKILHFQPVQEKPHAPFWWGHWKSCKLHTGDSEPAWLPHLWRSCLWHVEGSRLQRKYWPVAPRPVTANLGPCTVPNMPSVSAWYTPDSFFGFFLLKCCARICFFRGDSVSLLLFPMYLFIYIFNYIIFLYTNKLIFIIFNYVFICFLAGEIYRQGKYFLTSWCL